MSKLTISDVKDALKPLERSIEGLRVDATASSTQISEIYAMVVALSTKLDTLEQVFNKSISAPTVVTKSKKTSAKKASAKTAKKEDAEDEEDAKSDTSEKKLPPKKLPNKKGAGSKVDKSDKSEKSDKPEKAKKSKKEEEGSQSDEEDSKKAVKKTVKSSKPTKTSKSTKKPKNSAPVKRQLNKMEFFSKMYEEDEHYFDTYITEKDKAAIAKEHPEWKDLEEDDLKKAKCSPYYIFMRDNHDSILQSMKGEYIDRQNTSQIEIAEKDNNE